MGLEGIVSKRIDAPYRSGPFLGWRKIKCPGYARPVKHKAGRQSVGKRVVGMRLSRCLFYPPNDVFRLRKGFDCSFGPEA